MITERSITNRGIPILLDFLKLSRFFIVFEKFPFLLPFFFFLLNVKLYRKKIKNSGGSAAARWLLAF